MNAPPPTQSYVNNGITTEYAGIGIIVAVAYWPTIYRAARFRELGGLCSAPLAS